MVVWGGSKLPSSSDGGGPQSRTVSREFNHVHEATTETRLWHSCNNHSINYYFKIHSDSMCQDITWKEMHYNKMEGVTPIIWECTTTYHMSGHYQTMNQYPNMFSCHLPSEHSQSHRCKWPLNCMLYQRLILPHCQGWSNHHSQHLYV